MVTFDFTHTQLNPLAVGSYPITISSAEIGDNLPITSTNVGTLDVTAAPTYIATVTNGTGGGSYAAGTTVNITANTPPAGQVFDKWTSNEVTFVDAYAPNTKFTMPANAVTVTAVYKEATLQTYPVAQIPTAENDYTMKVDVDYADFKSVEIDGKTITATTDYTSFSGSTFVKLTPSYLATLTTGNHTMVINFTGGSSNTPFTKAGTGTGTGTGGTTTGGGVTSSDGTIAFPNTYKDSTGIINSQGVASSIGSQTGSTNPATGMGDMIPVSLLFALLSLLSAMVVRKKKIK